VKQGIYQLTMPEYLALNALSSGVVNTLLTESPHHARFAQLNERTASVEADLGTFAHAMLLEGGTDALCVIDANDWRTKAAQEQRDAARATGKLPILARKVAEVEAMVKAAREYVEQSEIAGIFDDGKPEQTLIWTEIVQGTQAQVICKARPDWLSERYVLHYKTTQASVNPRQFARIASGSGYDTALMFYLRGLCAVLPDNECQHFILAQEQNSPWACKLFDLTAARADVAEAKIERAIGVWARCLANNSFPAYDGSVFSLDLSPWELAQAEEDMLTDGELAGGIPA
jgi:hypothetical protein